jgi:hypothetical protein
VVTFTLSPSSAYVTVVFFIIPAGIFDLASLSFQLPIWGFWAELMTNATEHTTNVNSIDLTFIFSPVCKARM